MEQYHFTDSIFYQIELTAKYCRLLGQQVFEKYDTGVTVEEYSVLDVLLCSPKMCQRDLAKLILKDRANTGKLIDSLEKKGFVKRHLSIKNNRPVKFVELTEEGSLKLKDINMKLEPHTKLIKEKIHNSDIAKVSDLLRELREFLGETLEMKI